jgi:hypothetical protein
MEKFNLHPLPGLLCRTTFPFKASILFMMLESPEPFLCKLVLKPFPSSIIYILSVCNDPMTDICKFLAKACLGTLLTCSCKC